MRPLELAHEPTIRWRADARRGELDVLITRAAPSVSLHMGLSAVLRDRSGKIYYWALQHPPGKPDFHHAAGFAGTLDGDID